MNNEELIIKYRETNDEQYLTELYNKNKKLIYKVQQKLKCDLDLLWVCFMKAVHALDTTKGKFSTLFYRISLNEFSMDNRKQRISTVSMETNFEGDLTYNDVLAYDDDFDLEQTLSDERLLTNLMSELTEREKTIIELKFIEGLTYKEMEKIVGLKTRSLCAIINKTIKKLHYKYSKYYKKENLDD